MPRPTTQTELITATVTQWDRLWSLIDTLPDEVRFAVFDFGDDPKLKEAHWRRDKNLRDIFIHLYEWHQLLLNWVSANQGGVAKPFLPEPYNWKTYPQLNEEFREKHQDTSAEKAEELLRQSHKEVMVLIESFSDEELFAKKHFTWTGTSSLGGYCVSATVSHYDWALKKIKKHQAMLASAGGNKSD